MNIKPTIIQQNVANFTEEKFCAVGNSISPIKYACSRTTVENLSNLLAAPDWKDAKDVVEQWKTIEDDFWYVVPEEEE